MVLPLLIVGPTASGKTQLSLSVATKIPDMVSVAGVDILVIDSKQVYKKQDVVTGKDKDKNFTFHTFDAGALDYYAHKHIRIYGLDLVYPNQEWSVALFLSYAQAVKEQAEKQNRFLLIVGGTPLYTLSLFNSPQTASVAPDQSLREELSLSSIEQLQERLKKLSWKRFRKMNESDQRNPRRLVRAIEIELAKKLQGGWLPAHQAVNFTVEPLFRKEECVWIGLSTHKETLAGLIRERVIERLHNGAIREYSQLTQEYPDWRAEAKSAIGYSEIEQYVTGQIEKEELIPLWTIHEIQYAKRQMTWWKREKQIEWFEADSSTLASDVLNRIKHWYT